MQPRRERALLRGQVAVRGGDREAVAVAQGRTADDVDGQEKIIDQTAHHDQLLKIPLAEHRDVRPDYIEELDEQGAASK